MHVLIKALAIRQIEHRSETHSNESQHLASETEEARLRWRFSFVLQQALLFLTRHHLCRQRVTLAGTRQVRSQGPVSVHAHCPEGVTRSEGRKGANGVEVGIGDENGGGGGNGDVNGDGDGEGPGTGVEAIERTQDVNGDGSGDGAGTGTGVETHGRTRDGDGDGSGDGNEGSSGDGDGDGDGIKERPTQHPVTASLRT